MAQARSGRALRVRRYLLSMTRLAIADILVTASVDAQGHLDPARVDFYRRTIDRFPGSRAEALDYAAAVGARQRGLPPEEVKDRIIRLYGFDSTGRER